MNQRLGSNLTVSEKITKLQDSSCAKEQVSWARQISLNDLTGQKALLEFLINRRIVQKVDISSLDGIIFEILIESSYKIIKDDIKRYFPNGLFQFNASSKVDYQSLQNLLIQQKYQEADRLTQIKLCELVGLNNKNERNWLYFTDISSISSEDLSIIDLLWRVYSRDKFGFSIQRQIWLSSNCNWEKLWTKIGWKNEGVERRYPHEFIWDLNAPQGHLPLFNQLRGVQVLSALFNHVLWTQ
uniref:GUN4-like domain-containing protein n=1 Tax=Eucheuma denticulatum TaxID=305493 RepID=A0A8E7UEH7_9FLOR|nr:hypothetical protein [Eucheuma denticulatum]